MTARGLALALVVAALGCQGKEPAPAANGPPPLPTEPSTNLVQRMGEYCRISELPRDQQREAVKAWGWSAGGDPELGPIWHRAAAKREPAAIALIKKAAAASKTPCPILDALQ